MRWTMHLRLGCNSTSGGSSYVESVITLCRFQYFDPQIELWLGMKYGFSQAIS